MKTFFFGDHLNLGRKTDLIWVKSNQNLGQGRLMLFPSSKTAPHLLQIPGYAPTYTLFFYEAYVKNLH